MEIGGYYARQVRNQRKVYPAAVGVAGVVVATLSILGSLAIAVVVPKKDISLSGGVMQALTVFFDDLDIEWAIKPIGVLVIVGVIGSLVSWAIGPAMGMQRVGAEGGIAPWWARTNGRGAPVSVLLLQAVIGSLLSLLLLFVDSINTYYWMLTALVAQTFLVMYLLMYAAVLHLRRTQPDVPRPVHDPRRPGRPRPHRRRRHRRLGVHLRARLPARQPPLGRGHRPLRARHGARHRRRVRHPVPAPPGRTVAPAPPRPGARTGEPARTDATLATSTWTDRSGPTARARPPPSGCCSACSGPTPAP